MKCPRPDCDERLILTVHWWDYPARWSDWDGGSPPDSGWEIPEFPAACPAGHKFEEKDFDEINESAEKASLDADFKGDSYGPDC